MPLPFLIPALVSLVAKVTVTDLIVTTVVATTVANATNDAYQKLKGSAHFSDGDKCNRD